jgi:hypothetical protein
MLNNGLKRRLLIEQEDAAATGREQEDAKFKEKTVHM